MVQFFMEGGWGMYPVLIVGVILLVSAAQYAFDGEPVRLRVITALALLLLVFVAEGMLTDVATVLWYVASDEHGLTPELRSRALLEGLKESTRPGVLGLGLLGLGLTLVTIGVHRVGRRELAAARG